MTTTDRPTTVRIQAPSPGTAERLIWHCWPVRLEGRSPTRLYLRQERERTLNAYVKGLISEAEAEQRLPALRAEQERIERELAAIEQPAKVIALHPAALARYLATVDRFAAALSDHARDGEHDLVAAFRGLVQA